MIPRATYRLQFRNGMDFAKAIEIVPYLQRLGISHLYASPIFAAVTGSTHGYDVIDHNVVDPALGGEAGLFALSRRLRKAGMGLIVDIVPNHMAASLENPWWRDVIEWGRNSAFADHFDIDWSRELTLPILPSSYEDALDAGELSLQIDRRNACLTMACFGNLLPLHPGSYAKALAPVAEPLARSLSALAAHAQSGAEAWRQEARRLLASPALDAFEQHLARLSKDRAHIARICRLQPWRLMNWRDAGHSLSYRRFFEIAGLVGVRVEREQVFEDVHRLTFALSREGIVDGLRIDHVDGLADPGAYLKRLRAAVGPEPYLAVEKILAQDETLPAEWPVQGTTGYEFISASSQVLVEAEGRSRLAEAYVKETGSADGLEAERWRAKRLVVQNSFAGELRRLVRLTAGAARCFAESDLEPVIGGLIAAFPVYRTYGDDAGMNQRDRHVLDKAAATLRAREAVINDDALRWLIETLAGSRDVRALELRRRFQQLTSAVMAKAVEDTLFYRWHPFIALNEVGCDPGQKLGGSRSFHDVMAARATTSPHGLLATATHDTKRGEDARARLYALSEKPEMWLSAMARWRALNGHAPSPGPNVEWLVYQSLAGIWPAGRTVEDAADRTQLAERLSGFLEKAMREEKLHTSWTDVNTGYEDAVRRFAKRILSPDNRQFLADFASTMEFFAQGGWINSVAQTLIKLTAPGIADIYQGSERSDYSLVDPDNRRAVDFSRLEEQLAEPDAAPDRAALASGRMKQRLITACLAFRQARPELFTNGSYEPLYAKGRRSDHVIAYLRRFRRDAALVIAPRLTSGGGWPDAPGDYWKDTRVELPEDLSGIWENVLSPRTRPQSLVVGLGATLRSWPVALLIQHI